MNDFSFMSIRESFGNLQCPLLRFLWLNCAFLMNNLIKSLAMDVLRSDEVANIRIGSVLEYPLNIWHFQDLLCTCRMV